MFRFIAKKIRYIFKRVTTSKEAPIAAKAAEGLPDIAGDLDKNLAYLKSILGTSGDLVFHEFVIGKNQEYKAALIFIDGLVKIETITECILKPLLINPQDLPYKDLEEAKDINIIKQRIIFSGEVSQTNKTSDIIEGCLGGDTILLLDGFSQGLIVSSKGWEKRSVTEPQTESVIRGPREGFTEDFRTNTSLLRRRIKTPQLRMDHLSIGEKTATNICIVYIQDVADPEIIKTVKYRLEQLKVDSILDSGYIEQYIDDSPLSIFTTIGYSEKPDVVAGRILEGRIAIIVEGSPFVLTVPMLFLESFQTAEDYYSRTFYANTTRLLRFIAYFIAVLAPALFIALTTFHQEFIPTTLLISIATAREGTPFPAFFEALIMIFSFEILREAGLRLPRPVGQAISIVGALIMGDAAVSAGIVGAPMVITVAITAVSGFIVPDQNDSASILRLIFLVLAAFLGGFGITMGLIAVLVHLSALKSFGVPYLASLAPAQLHDLEDSVFRMPLWIMTKRPESIAKGDITRKKYLFPPAMPNKSYSAPENDEEQKR